MEKQKLIPEISPHGDGAIFRRDIRSPLRIGGLLPVVLLITAGLPGILLVRFLLLPGLLISVLLVILLPGILLIIRLAAVPPPADRRCLAGILTGIRLRHNRYTYREISV